MISNSLSNKSLPNSNDVSNTLMPFSYLVNENSLSSFSSILQRSFKEYQLPEAYKIWTEESLQTHFLESKLSTLITFGKLHQPTLLHQSLSEKHLLTMKLTDEIETTQLQIDFNSLLQWSLPIWFKHLSFLSKKLYWNKL